MDRQNIRANTNANLWFIQLITGACVLHRVLCIGGKNNFSHVCRSTKRRINNTI